MTWDDLAVAKTTELTRIWMFAFGSRGDVQPYVAVAHGLVKRGYKITFFCNAPSFAKFAASFGCKGVSMCDKEADVYMRENPRMMKAMMTGNVMVVFQGLKEETKQSVPTYCEAFLKELNAQGPPDLCMIMPLTNYFGWYLAIRHKVPFFPMSTYAAVYNPEHPPFGLPKLPFGLTKYLFQNIVLKAVYDGVKGYDNYLQANILDQYPWPLFQRNILNRVSPVLILGSFEIAKVLAGGAEQFPRDKLITVGTTVIEQDLQLQQIDNFGGQHEFDRLQQFLDNGEKPVYLGWGSMISQSSEFMVQLCARAAFRSNHRAVVLGGFANLSMELLASTNIEPHVLEYAKKHLLFVKQAPHEWLFPRVSVIVHHGGAGTTTAALRAGVPSVITPVFADQWDFSYFLRKTGVGIGFDKQFQKITSNELGDAIRKAASDQEMKQKAVALGEKLRAENGVAQAVLEVERFWEDSCISGTFHSRFPGTLLSKRFTESIWFRSSLVLGAAIILAQLIAFIQW
ncbi:hypothetical protein MPSEU_000327800 [Mayamaea pseudoterrestris]|nr:hypothetical protein MPSEU_000327800 [Mayamaea pseudoterrestris]